MDKVIWSETSPDYSGLLGDSVGGDAKGLETARGLLIGLAISQVFWLAIALFFL